MDYEKAIEEIEYRTQLAIVQILSEQYATELINFMNNILTSYSDAPPVE